jgi:hypothetical protein
MMKKTDSVRPECFRIREDEYSAQAIYQGVDSDYDSCLEETPGVLHRSKGGPKMDARSYRLQPWEELAGPADKVEVLEGNCIAQIGKISVCLPLGLAAWLQERKGKQVAILRTDSDFRFLVL